MSRAIKYEVKHKADEGTRTSWWVVVVYREDGSKTLETFKTLLAATAYMMQEA